jgi:hypothetical protein
MCHCIGETVDHLLLHCPVAGILWNWVFCVFGISWVIFGRVADMLFGWWNGLGQHPSDIWNLIPLCLMWIVWKEGNRLIFEAVTSSDSKLLDGFALTLFDWSRAWGFTTSTILLNLFLLCLYFTMM